MDKQLAVYKLLGPTNFNPACFDFSEQEAREKGLWRDSRPMPTQAELDAAMLLANKDMQVSSAYETKVDDMYTSLQTTFGTKNDISVLRQVLTWEAMLKRPVNYIDASIGFTDSAAVTAYATSKLDAADAYALSAMKRELQFQSEKTTILGV